MSVLAGILISIGCVCYLNIGGVIGSAVFAVGLLSIIFYDFKLFTGKAGLLATKQIKVESLCRIWLGNLAGVFLGSIPIGFSSNYPLIQEKCISIMQLRQDTGFLGSFLLAIPCGILMYLAVAAPKHPMKPLYVIMCVMAFINGGFFHCIADMFFTFHGAVTLHQLFNFLIVTIGNLIGCNIIPFIKKRKGYYYD